ncbi:MAG: amidohydrolase family protein [Armatimonadota bacterium]
MLDIALVNGQLVDGLGGEPKAADLGIKGGRIETIAPRLGAAKLTIDAAGRCVAPGFIDVHNHGHVEGEGGVLTAPGCQNLVAQGVTTIVCGNCGDSPLPIGEHLARVEAVPRAVNYAVLVGHGVVRSHVMGTRASKPTSAEAEDMRSIVAEAMDQGAVGVSTGLWYVPGAFAEVSEIIDLATVVSAAGGIYASHVRDEADGGLAAAEEAIEVGRRAGISVQISHLKRWGQPHAGTSADLLARVDAARAAGISVNADAYPYEASSTGLATLLPRKAFESGKFEERMDDPEQREQAQAFARARLENIGGPERVLITRCSADASLVGKRLAEAASIMGQTAEDCIIELVIAGPVGGVFFAMDPADVDRILSHPAVMVGSDGSAHADGESLCHPRTYGCFARVLRRMVREKKLLSLGEAVRKMTSLPAAKFGFQGRGALAEGNWADIVVFDPQTIADTATYEQPRQYPVGLDWALVNGEVVFERGQFTPARPGRILRHTGS